jgi:hypothetical protein
MRSVFADESKQNVYIFGVASLESSRVDPTRRALRELVLPGQRSIHFASESDRRRVQLLKTILSMGHSVSIIDTGEKDNRVGRIQGLEMLTNLAIAQEASLLVIEKDETSFRTDRQLLKAFAQVDALKPRRFEIKARHEEPLLWIPDSIAWCYQRGGDFRRALNRAGLERYEG